MKITLDQIKELRDMTQASISACQKALQDTKGDIAKAVELLRKKGLEIAAKKRATDVREGRIEAYIHTGNKIGVLVEVACETDFAARNSDFCQFSKDIAMQIAASNPAYLKKEDVPEQIIKKEKDKEAFYKEHCLLEQVYIKDTAITVQDYLGSVIAKIGENIFIRRFTRYKLGE